MRTLANIVRIKYFKTVEINQRLVVFPGIFIQEKMAESRNLGIVSYMAFYLFIYF